MTARNSIETMGKHDDDLASSFNGMAGKKDPDVHVVAPSSNGSEMANEDKNSLALSTDHKKDKRFLPSYKKPDAALTFPEKVCL